MALEQGTIRGRCSSGDSTGGIKVRSQLSEARSAYDLCRLHGRFRLRSGVQNEGMTRPTPPNLTGLTVWARHHINDLRETGLIILHNLYGVAAVAIAMGMTAVVISLFGGLNWRPADPDGLFPLVGSAFIVAGVAALRPKWRPVVSAVWAGGVVTIAWIAALVIDFNTPAMAAESRSWIWCTVFASAAWLLAFRPIAAAEQHRVAALRQNAEHDQFVTDVAAEVVRLLEDRR
ncbi:hypothetical protein [Curtobacterium luteum]|uniref:hypothetical protein n=1 Tax=Curtobacterium luteum TaxID=33881 RepID=UPI0038106F36